MLKRYNNYFVILTTVCSLMACTNGTTVPSYVMDGDVFTLEIEDLPSEKFEKGKWEIHNSYSGYSGSGYALWTGESIWGNSSQPDSDNKRYLQFDLKISDPGTYYIKLKNYHQEVDGDNDVWVKTPGRSDSIYLKYYDHDVKAWTLDETSDWAHHELKKGKNLIEIVGRSHGFAVDQVIVMKETAVLPQEPVNPKASKETKALLSYLYQIKNKGGILSGMHNDLKEPVKWDNNLIERNGQVQPAIWGSDFRYGDHVPFRQKMIDEAIRQHKEYSKIITLMYHQVRPMDDEMCCGNNIWSNSIQGEISELDMKELLTSGTPLNNQWKQKWDSAAIYLQQLEDEDVPVLFRPYHEMNGSWFWWGKKAGLPKEGKEGRDASLDYFKELYRMTFQYLTEAKGLNNLLWVINYDDTNNDLPYYYPGDNYVDVIATDVYKNQYSIDHYAALRKLAGEKPIALGEVSSLPKLEELQTLYKDYVWFMGWRELFIKELNDAGEGNSDELLQSMFNSAYVINANELAIKKD